MLKYYCIFYFVRQTHTGEGIFGRFRKPKHGPTGTPRDVVNGQGGGQMISNLKGILSVDNSARAIDDLFFNFYSSKYISVVFSLSSFQTSPLPPEGTPRMCRTKNSFTHASYFFFLSKTIFFVRLTLLSLSPSRPVPVSSFITLSGTRSSRVPCFSYPLSTCTRCSPIQIILHNTRPLYQGRGFVIGIHKQSQDIAFDRYTTVVAVTTFSSVVYDLCQLLLFFKSDTCTPERRPPVKGRLGYKQVFRKISRSST